MNKPHCLEIEKKMLGDDVGVTHLPRLTSRVLLETVWPWRRGCFSDLQLEIANWM